MALADLIDAHRGAFEYEWRARFHLPLTVVGETMSWGEAYRLTQILANDPGSPIAAGIARWEHPLSREAMALADLYDLQHASKAKKRPRPYPRPWGDKERKTRGNHRLSIAELDALLAANRAPREVTP